MPDVGIVSAVSRDQCADPSVVRLLTDTEIQWRAAGPTSRAVRSFGADATNLRRLPGGQGNVWSDGRVVLKTVGCVPEHTWVCGVYDSWPADGDVRVPRPLRPESRDEEPGWSVDGWGAHLWVEGRDLELPREVAEVRAASDAFHRHLAGVPRPAFLDVRHDPWSLGDRIAWEGAEPVGDEATLALMTPLLQALRPVSDVGQPVHGDILPNVLVEDGMAPAVIDWPPYFRPVGFANAIAVTDAMTFKGAPLTLMDDWADGDAWDQLLVRALIYRFGPTGYFAVHGRLMGSLLTHVERARPVVDAVLGRLQTEG